MLFRSWFYSFLHTHNLRSMPLEEFCQLEDCYIWENLSMNFRWNQKYQRIAAVVLIVLGCFLDGISIVVLTMGVLLPTVQAAGIDLIWFGIFIVFVVEMAQITPPVGFNLFVLSGMSGRELPYIARASLPMFFLMILAVLLLYLVPGIATWLPLHMTL